jgi:hypothetical protein
MYVHEVYAHEVHAHEVYTHEVHVYKMHVPEIYAYEINVYKIHICKIHVYKIHIREMYDHGSSYMEGLGVRAVDIWECYRKRRNRPLYLAASSQVLRFTKYILQSSVCGTHCEAEGIQK